MKKGFPFALMMSLIAGIWGINLILPLQVDAQLSFSEIQNQIQQLMARVAGLRAQIALQSQNPSTGIGGTEPVFTRDLSAGIRGTDVAALQRFLNSHGFPVASSGPGARGNETTYFGSLTRGAVTRFQISRGLPASGQFNAATRQTVIGILANETNPPAETTIPRDTTSSNSITESGLSLRSITNAINDTVSGGSRLPVFAMAIVGGTDGPIELKSMTFEKTGTLPDTAIRRSYLLYRGQVIAESPSVANGMLRFADINFAIPAYQTLEITLAVDANSPGTISFSLNRAGDIAALNAGKNAAAIRGSFPIKSKTITISAVTPSTLSVAGSPLANTINASSSGSIIGSWRANANKNLSLKSITLRLSGTANRNDIHNVKLLVNFSSTGSIIATVAGDGIMHFDLANQPPALFSGENSIRVLADITGNAGNYMEVNIEKSSDIYAVDPGTNAGASVVLGSLAPARITIR